MRKERFIYNTHTLRYEKVVQPWSVIIIKIFGFLCAALVSAFILTLLTHRYFPSPTEANLRQENEQLAVQYEDILKELQRLNKHLLHLRERDAFAHRMIFGMEPIDDGVWEGGVGGHDKYAEHRHLKESGALLISVRQKIDKLKRQMVIQSKSLDTITNLAAEKEKMIAAMPSIKPVRSDKLSRNVNLLSGFGRRIHPIYKVPRMHYGIDFTAPAGTPIQATGAGTVEKAEYSGTGYGLHVVINHGYGYKTLYGHMSRIDVKVGQNVNRGQQIGLVGNTGTSTAPHCHYEVHLRGVPVNPIHYCIDGLSPREYQELVKASEASNQSFD
jgi:hypothetical protein